MKTLIRFLNEEKGVTAIEYALIASLISIAAIGAMQFIGKQLNNIFYIIGGYLR